MCIYIYIYTYIYTYIYRETDRQTDRETQRKREREKGEVESESKWGKYLKGENLRYVSVHSVLLTLSVWLIFFKIKSWKKSINFFSRKSLYKINNIALLFYLPRINRPFSLDELYSTHFKVNIDLMSCNWQKICLTDERGMIFVSWKEWRNQFEKNLMFL